MFEISKMELAPLKGRFNNFTIHLSFTECGVVLILRKQSFQKCFKYLDDVIRIVLALALYETCHY